MKNLSVDDKSELFRLYEESFATGQVPEDWSHSYLKPIPKPGKDHSKLNGYRILTMQNTTGKLMGRMAVWKLAQDLERRNVLPPNQGGYRAGKSTWENAARFVYDVYERFRRKGQTLAVSADLEDQQSAIQTADGTPCAVWRRLDSHKMVRSGTPEKKGCHATWKLHLHVLN